MRKSALFGAGALLPALGASLGWVCCMPILGGAAGALAASLGSTLLPFRPYLAGISLVALAAGFFQAYRPERPCGPDGACAAPASRRGLRILMWVVAAVVAATLTVQSWSSWLIYWTL